MKTHEEKINRILRDAFEKGLIEPSSMSPAELGKAIQDEYEANPPSLKERVWAHLYAFQLSLILKKGK
jgi:hypothetical protein